MDSFILGKKVEDRNQTMISYLKKLKNIKNIDLRSINISSLDMSDLTELTNLKSIWLDNNRLVDINFPKMDTVQMISLNSNYLTTVPSTVTNLINLTNLQICDNNINLIPNFLTVLTKLTVLNMSSILDEKITKLQKLTNLNVNANKIENISMIQFQYLTNLINLNLGNNKIIDLPIFPVSLKTIILTNNKIKEFYQTDLTNLEMICLSNNCLDQFPNIENSYNLKHISLCNNKITNIPNYLIKFNIVYFDFSHNLIDHIPKIFKKVNYIQIYNFYKNNIKSIDDSFCLLNDFREFILTGNPIQKYKISDLIKKARSNIKIKFKNCYYISKYGHRVEMFYIKHIKNKNINTEILYSPDLKFYLNLIDPDVLTRFKQIQ